MRNLFTLMAIVALFSSCQKNLNVDNVEVKSASIDQQTAKLTALEVSRTFFKKKGIPNVDKVIEYKDSKGDIAIYAFNFSSGGYCLISASENYDPILAISESNKFEPIDGTPQSKWLNSQIKSIEDFRELNEVDTTALYSWSYFTSGQRGLDPDDEDVERPPIYENINPLILTYWDQHAPLNRSSTYRYLENGKLKYHFAGCYPVAIAQVCNYLNKPSFIDWSVVPDGSKPWARYSNQYQEYYPDGGIQMSLLGEWLAKKLNVDIKPDGTGVRDTRALNMIKREIYKDTKYMTQNFGKSHREFANVIHSELRLKYPVIVSGNNDGGTGHAFIVDGMRRFSYGQVDQKLFHPNWGWGKTSNEADYYKLDNFGYDGNGEYSEKMRLIYNIR